MSINFDIITINVIFMFNFCAAFQNRTAKICRHANDQPKNQGKMGTYKIIVGKNLILWFNTKIINY
jgi:hypothetical protein